MTSPMAHTPITYVSVETVCVSSSGSNRRGDVSLHGLIICVWVSRKRVLSRETTRRDTAVYGCDEQGLVPPV